MSIHDYIRTDSDNSFIVRGQYFDHYNDAWRAALGMWQASRYALPSDNTNMSDTDILATIGQEVREIVASHG